MRSLGKLCFDAKVQDHLQTCKGDGDVGIGSSPFAVSRFHCYVIVIDFIWVFFSWVNTSNFLCKLVHLQSYERYGVIIVNGLGWKNTQ